MESAAFTLRHLGAGEPLLARVRLGVAFVTEGRHDMDAMFDNHWRAADPWPNSSAWAGRHATASPRPSNGGTAGERRPGWAARSF
jgi:hypothetical protein